MTTTNPMGSGNEVESAAFHVPVSHVSSPPARTGFRVLSGAKGRVTKVQTSMKTSPMLWAGIAAGSGFALGLVGRFVHWRNYHRRTTPDLVIIDASC